jgi:hypothetical protein
MNSEFGLFQQLGTKANLLVRRRHSNSRKIWAIRVRLQIFCRTRELALFDLGIDSKLRACQLLKLKVRDVCHGERVAARAIVVQHTKPSLIYRRTKNLRAVQLLLGHTKLESTIRYLGIEVEDALELAEQTEV